jgi:hypothetical protein
VVARPRRLWPREMIRDGARRMHWLLEPIHLVTYFSGGPTEVLMALGLGANWPPSGDCGRWPVAVQDLAAVGAGRGDGAVGVQGDGPAPAVDGD